MIKLKVGEPYPLPYQPGITANLFQSDNAVLQVAMPGITQNEIKDYRKGKLKAGLLYEHNIILLFFKFGNQPRIDAPFSIHRIAEFQTWNQNHLDCLSNWI